MEALQKAQEETIRARDSEIQRLQRDTPRSVLEDREILKKLTEQIVQDKNEQLEQKDELIKHLRIQHASEVEIKKHQEEKAYIEASRDAFEIAREVFSAENVPGIIEELERKIIIMHGNTMTALEAIDSESFSNKNSEK